MKNNYKLIETSLQLVNVQRHATAIYAYIKGKRE